MGDLVDELADRGASDWRIREIATGSRRRVVEDWGHSLDLEARWRLDAIVDGLDATATAVANAGLPDTLVHGDFHAGNVRGDPSTVEKGLPSSTGVTAESVIHCSTRMTSSRVPARPTTTSCGRYGSTSGGKVVPKSDRYGRRNCWRQ